MKPNWDTKIEPDESLLAIFLANGGRKSKGGIKPTYPRSRATCAHGKQ